MFHQLDYFMMIKKSTNMGIDEALRQMKEKLDSLVAENKDLKRTLRLIHELTAPKIVYDVESPPEEEYEKFLEFTTFVVSPKHYSGKVQSSEHVKIVREPDNDYDVNAIQVCNGSNKQLGYFPLLSCWPL